MHKITGIIVAMMAFCGCVQRTPPVEPGVRQDLAQERSGRITDLSYHLSFEIPALSGEPCRGTVTIGFELKGKGPVQLDFRPQTVQDLTVNGEPQKVKWQAEHILVEGLKEGHNDLRLGFTPEDAPLNRHDDYLYTLLVPERARTLFPCFDQPDLKAGFTLELTIPEGWEAVANGALEEESTVDGRKRLRFARTRPISTYLFAFAAGKWQKASFDRAGKPMQIYYRESDPAKVSQLPEIHRQICFALDWMEDFTGIPMPFPKYDCVIVPGFQFGGMEHPGAIFFSESRMFLNQAPTDADRCSRIDLIAHETAHLWFGDAVTMRWFNDVWTKEVFANYFAAQVSRPLFPEIDFRTKDFRSFNIPAYAEDRSTGSTPIRQRLDNLQDAGLVYGNIVYDKAPVVMRMLADTLGADAFRAGMREYLQAYLGGNASWPDLIDILDSHMEADLSAWSHRWVEEKGMPEYPETDGLPNLDAQGYGYYPMSAAALEKALAVRLTAPHERLSNLANLYENMLHGRVEPLRLAERIGVLLQEEDHALVAASALSYLNELWHLSGYPLQVEDRLLSLVRQDKTPAQIRLQAFRSLVHVVSRPETVEDLYELWEHLDPWPGLTLSEEDYTSLSYELAVRRPDRYASLYVRQRDRIGNADRRARFDFVFPSAHPSKAVRDSVFRSLLDPENRITEPWVLQSLRLLNHPLRQEEALGYIVPGLDALQEIQRTGDIFFPKNWAVALLSGHDSPAAAAIVRNWLDAHPDYPPLLLNKILQAADRLTTAAMMRSSSPFSGENTDDVLK